MQVYLTQFQYPGQLPWNPVQNQGSYTVFPFNLSPALGYLNPALQSLSVALDQIISPYGAITFGISNDGLVATNYTQPTHIFHEGQVDHELSQLSGGTWIVTTHGTGTNSSQFVAVVNQVIGPVTFEAVNAMMAGYVFVDQVTGGLP